MKLEQGKIVVWKNKKEEQIVWMVTDSHNTGVVIHSDNLLKLGTLCDLSKYSVLPFVGQVKISSE